MVIESRGRRPSLTYPEIPAFEPLRVTARRRPDKIAFVDGDRTMAFAELDAATDRLASSLVARGISQGDRVTLFLPNCIEFAIAYYGVLKAGAVPSPASVMLKDRELAFQVNDSDAVALIAHQMFLSTVSAAREAMSGLRQLLVTGSEAPAGAELLSDLVASGGEPPSPRIDVYQDLAALPYTSGTTGNQKGVMLTHHNLISNQLQYLDACQLGEEDSQLVVLPMFHIYALNLLFAASVHSGATQVLMPRFDPERCLQLIQEHQIRVFFVVPPIILALVNFPKLGDYDLSSLRYFFTGAAPLPVELGRQLQEKTGVTVNQGYGLTEASPVTHANPLSRIELGTIGIPVADCDQRIVDLETGTRELGPDEVGELAVRGPMVMKGYWKRPEDTSQVLRDGWLFTGDVASMDRDGYVTIVDRAKEMIKYKGFGVGPADLEAVLVEHPAVRDCAVIGVPDAEAGELPKAFVVRRPEHELSAEALMAWVKERVAEYKRIRAVDFVEQIPRSASGKILRRLLRQQ